MAGTVKYACWHVLGAGAIGCLFAGALQRAGSPTTVLLRAGATATGITVAVAREGATRRVELPVSTAIQPGHISHLLVTTKAQDVCTAVMSVGHRLDSSSQVLLLANGLGFAEELRASLPSPVYYYGTTTEAAYRRDPSRQNAARREIYHAGSGITRIGRPGISTPPAWFEQWARAVQPSIWDPVIEQSLWLKLAINCAINPLTALHRCPNGDLARPHLAPRVANLCEEIMQVSAAAGYAEATANLPARVAEVVTATAANRSSMLQDVLAGRATEIDYITGHLLRVAVRHGIAAPANEALYRSIAALAH